MSEENPRPRVSGGPLVAVMALGAPALFIALRLLQFSVASVVHCSYRVGIVFVFALLLLGIFCGRLCGDFFRRHNFGEAVFLGVYFLLLWNSLPWYYGVAAAGFAGGLTSTALRDSKYNWAVLGVALIAVLGYAWGAQWFLEPLVSAVVSVASGIVLIFAAVVEGRKRFGVFRFAFLVLFWPLAVMFPVTALHPCGNPGTPAMAGGIAKIDFSSTPLGRIYLLTGKEGGAVVCNVAGRELKNVAKETLLRRSVLPAVLQFRRHDLKVLYIGYLPSRIPAMLAELPNVKRVEVASFSGRLSGNERYLFPAELLHDSKTVFDLIFVAELPPVDPLSRRVFVNELKTRLRPVDGTLVIPSQYIASGISVEYLPGTSQSMSIYSRGKAVTDWAVFTRNLELLNETFAESDLNVGVLEELKLTDSGARVEVPRSRQSSVEFFRSDKPASLWLRWLLAAAVAYLAIRLVAGRFGRGYYCFAAAENGYSLALVLLCSVSMLAHYRLVTCHFAPAMLLMLALARWRTDSRVAQKLLKGCYLAAVAYLSISQLYVALNPEWTLLLILPLAAAGSGVVEEGISRRAKFRRHCDALLMLGGALAATALYVVAEVNDFDENLLYFALLLRVLYMIRL